MSPKPCLHASPYSVRSVVYVSRSPSRFYDCWSHHWYWHGSTMVMRCWLVYQAVSSTDSSQWWMQLHGLYSLHGSPSTSHRCFMTFTSCWCLSGLSLNSLCLSTVACHAEPYIARELRRVVDIDSRRRLRSALTSALEVPSTRHVTIGDRSFGVAAARVWNTLPANVTSSSSLRTLPVFKWHLKTFLFTNFHA